MKFANDTEICEIKGARECVEVLSEDLACLSEWSDEWLIQYR